MKIQGPGPAPPSAARRREGVRSSGAGGFTVGAGAEARPRAPGAASGLDTISGIFSLQEVENETYSPRRRMWQRGEDLLDGLDEIRHGLLIGALPRERVVRLLALVRSRREQVADPRLSAILDEIELRAEVELAKLDPLT
jgi:hypothetical protein